MDTITGVGVMRKFFLAIAFVAFAVFAAPLPQAWASAEVPAPALGGDLVASPAAMEAAPAAEASGSSSVVEPAETRSVSATEVLSLLADEGQVLRLPRAATSVFVANPEIADIQVKSGSLLYIYGRKVGQTSFYAVDDADNVIASKTVIVGLNLGALRRAIRQITGTEGVQAQQVEDMILLSGAVDNASMAQDVVKVATRYLPRAAVEGAAGTDQVALGQNYIINRLSYNGSNQVNIRVRVAEVSREATKTLGISSDVANPSLFGDVDMAFGFDSGVSFTGAASTASLGTTWGATSLTTALDALVEDGMATILAEPNLTSLSGETANFLSGGEIPIPLVDTDGNVTVEFKEFGVRLAFTPTIVNGSRINLRVQPEVSALDDASAVSFSGGTLPGLRTRKAETSIELGSGQSFAIAGLLQNDSAQNLSKFPGLGDIPVLGALFRSEQFRQNQSELVIIVTPYLVKPVSASAMMSPTDSFVPPNDVDRLLHARLDSATPTPARAQTAHTGTSPADGGLSGDIGYVLQ